MDRNIHMMCTPNSEKYHLITRLELNYIVLDLNVSKNQAETVRFGLYEWKLLENSRTDSFSITAKELVSVFRLNGDMLLQ